MGNSRRLRRGVISGAEPKPETPGPWQGRRNAYQCREWGGRFGAPVKPGCGGHVITVDRDAGVTPAGLPCLFGCGGTMWSAFYRLGDATAHLPTDIEWRADHGPNACMTPYWLDSPTAARLGRHAGVPALPPDPKPAGKS